MFGEMYEFDWSYHNMRIMIWVSKKLQNREVKKLLWRRLHTLCAIEKKYVILSQYKTTAESFINMNTTACTDMVRLQILPCLAQSDPEISTPTAMTFHSFKHTPLSPLNHSTPYRQRCNCPVLPFSLGSTAEMSAQCIPCVSAKAPMEN